MIGSDRLGGRKLALDHPAHRADDFHRILGKVDFAPEQRDTRAEPFGLANQFQRVARGARAAAQDTDDQIPRIERGKFCHRPRAVILHFQKQRAFRAGHPGETAHDGVVDVYSDVFAAGIDGEGGIENFQKMPHPGLAGLIAKLGIGIQRRHIAVNIVVECHRI